MLGNNMYAYCHNNPVLYVDPSGYIIVLSPDATEEQEEEYERAIAYLKTSETGRKLIECLETSSEVFTIVFVDDDNMGYSPSTNIIQFDTNSGLVVGDGTSAQSAALGLAHEMGHAAQDLDGTINALMGDINLVEANNLEVYETPIAKEHGEPTRRYYDDWTKVIDMQNSTHFITTSVRPWWNYLFFWNWGKPSKVAIDHNVT